MQKYPWLLSESLEVEMVMKAVLIDIFFTLLFNPWLDTLTNAVTWICLSLLITVVTSSRTLDINGFQIIRITISVVPQWFSSISEHNDCVYTQWNNVSITVIKLWSMPLSVLLQPQFQFHQISNNAVLTFKKTCNTLFSLTSLLYSFVRNITTIDIAQQNMFTMNNLTERLFILYAYPRTIKKRGNCDTFSNKWEMHKRGQLHR